MLAPHQARRSPEARQVNQLDRRPVLDPRPSPHPAAPAPPHALDVHHDARGRGSSSTPSTFTAGKPISSSHVRVGFVSTGALRIDWRQNPPILRAPVPRPRTLTHLTPRSDPKGRSTSSAHHRRHRPHRRTRPHPTRTRRSRCSAIRAANSGEPSAHHHPPAAASTLGAASPKESKQHATATGLRTTGSVDDLETTLLLRNAPAILDLAGQLDPTSACDPLADRARWRPILDAAVQPQVAQRTAATIDHGLGLEL